MLEVIIKQQLAGSFSSGTSVARSTAIRSKKPSTDPEDGESVHRDRDAEEIAMRKLNDERGMSLVEATIILMVLAILTAVIAPSAADYVNDARQTKVKEDVEAIGTSILRLVRDTGLGCVSDTPSPASTACTLANRVDLLVSNGNDPDSTAADYASPAGTTTPASNDNGWLGGITPVVAGNQDAMDDQLVTNAPSYSNVNFALGGGPKPGVGWRGSYLTGPVGPDPWGFKYQANTVFLQVASDATAGTDNGEKNGGWFNDVFVISPGPDGNVETKFGDAVTGATATVGDDILYILTGSSR